MRGDGARGGDAVFPLFLHGGVHYEEGVVGEVDGELALGVCFGVRALAGCITVATIAVLVIRRNDLAHPKLPRYPETETPNDGARAKVGKVVGVVAHALAGAVVAVHEGGVGGPGVRGLVVQFLPGGGGADAPRDFLVDGFAHLVGGIAHTGEAAADVLGRLVGC